MKKAIIFIIILAVFSTSGCHTLRKKFIRKKKSKEETPVYVDFKDYPRKPSRDAYIDYYIFVRGWLDELIETLEQGGRYKRQKRAINEAIMNVEQIISYYNQEGKEKVYPLYEDLLAIRREIERNPDMNLMKRNSTIKKTEYFKRRFEAEFNYTDAEKWME